MAIIGILISSAGLLALWLSGHWFGRMAIFTLLTPTLCFVVVASPIFAGVEVPAYLGAIGVAWLLADLPMMLRRQFVAVGCDRSPNIALEFVRPHGAGKPGQ